MRASVTHGACVSQLSGRVLSMSSPVTKTFNGLCGIVAGGVIGPLTGAVQGWREGAQVVEERGRTTTALPTALGYALIGGVLGLVSGVVKGGRTGVTGLCAEALGSGERRRRSGTE
jgi:hypothetical protein